MEMKKREFIKLACIIFIFVFMQTNIVYGDEISDLKKEVKSLTEQLKSYAAEMQSSKDSSAETNKSLRAVEDIEEIKQLVYRYFNCICFGKYDLYGDFKDYFWSENMMYNLAQPSQQANDPPIIIKGKEALQNFLENLSRGHAGKDEKTFVVHPLISVDGDTAKGSWVLYINYRTPEEGHPRYWVQTVFEHECVRENGRWKFSLIKARERIGKVPPDGPRPVEEVNRDIFGSE